MHHCQQFRNLPVQAKVFGKGAPYAVRANRWKFNNIIESSSIMQRTPERLVRSSIRKYCVLYHLHCDQKMVGFPQNYTKIIDFMTLSKNFTLLFKLKNRLVHNVLSKSENMIYLIQPWEKSGLLSGLEHSNMLAYKKWRETLFYKASEST